MLRLDELADDAHLDAGQESEERLGSVNYEVRICPQCQFSRTFRHARFWRGYRTCPSCSYRTASRRSTTLRAATYDRGGLVEVTETCGHCSHHGRWTRSTPKKTRPKASSSSRSSRSSSSRRSSDS